MRYKFAAAVGGILIAGGLLFASGALLDHSTALAVPGVNADALPDASASQTGGGASSRYCCISTAARSPAAAAMRNILTARYGRKKA